MKDTNGDGFPGPSYLDASAILKSYFPESDSDLLNAFLKGRRDLFTSDLAVTEVTSALCRRRREGKLDAERAGMAYREMLEHTEAGVFRLVELTSETHRAAERRLLATDGIELRAGDAIHLSLAISVDCRTIVTFDHRRAAAGRRQGLAVYPSA